MIGDDMLMAYADGELDEAARGEVEAAVAADPALAQRLEAHVALREAAKDAFGDVLSEPTPPQLLDAVTQARVVRPDFGKARSGARPAAWIGAIAASLVVGVIGGQALRIGGGEASLAFASNGVTAKGALARALDTQLASQRGGPVEIGLTFATTSGSYCRTFSLTKEALSGLACREGETWRAPVLAAVETPKADGYRMAGSGMAAEVAAAVDARIAGEAFDASQEQAARDEGWRPAGKSEAAKR